MNGAGLVLVTALVFGFDGIGARPVDFDTEVIPLLTRAGCNAGSCHGAAVGRGGFHLSLLGAEAALDYDTIVRELEGRRVDLARPEESLILTKPSGRLEHEGGVRLKPGGLAFERLRDWLRAGAPRISSRRLVDFTVEPARAIVARTGQEVALCATARFDDGAIDDVTGWTVFVANDQGAVELRTESGRTSARATRAGQNVVVARFLDRVVPVALIVPMDDRAVDLSGEPRENFIDEHVLSLLETLRLPAAPPAGDDAFLRRVRLDLTGRLPGLDERSDFLADTDPARRTKLVDRLLASEDFVEFWTYRFGEMLRIGAPGQDGDGARAFQGWLHGQLRGRTPLDALVRALLTAQGDTRRPGPAHFYATAADARAQAELVAQAFLGARLQCANCHNHPLDHWTRDDYHGLAALFARVERSSDGVIRLAPRGEVTHPATGEPARPRIPGARFLEPNLETDPRAELASWLTAPDNPLFARALVNRLWRALMGRGLVEPADDLRATNPATHPALIEELAGDFIAHRYDLRHTLRRIAVSATYSRTAATTERNRNDDRYYAHALTRALPAEVLADALADVTGVPERYTGLHAGTRAVGLVGPQVASESLDVLGRCLRQGSCEAPTAAVAGGGLAAALHRLNGPLLNCRLTAPEGRLQTLLGAGRSEIEVLYEFYLRALGRPAAPPERAFWECQFAAAPSPAERARLLEDAVWSLLSSAEFATNH